MIWDSPFKSLTNATQAQSIQETLHPPPLQSQPQTNFDSFCAVQEFETFSCAFEQSGALYLPPPELSTSINHNYNTDIPVLDSLFSELNSDFNEESRNNLKCNFGIKSEPVNLEDIERILLPAQKPNRKSKCTYMHECADL